jgi:hypothetical protein
LAAFGGPSSSSSSSSSARDGPLKESIIQSLIKRGSFSGISQDKHKFFKHRFIQIQECPLKTEGILRKFPKSDVTQPKVEGFQK